nr:MAG TPA: hypothetical protein [Caudoviricetes sp.]
MATKNPRKPLIFRGFLILPSLDYLLLNCRLPIL